MFSCHQKVVNMEARCSKNVSGKNLHLRLLPVKQLLDLDAV